MGLALADLLRLDGIDDSSLLVLRHRPWQPKLANILPWLADQRPDLFNTYQSTQGPRAEAALSNASMIASFVARGSDQAVLAGLYRNAGGREISLADHDALPEVRELAGLGMLADPTERTVERFRLFDLQPDSRWDAWKGRLVIDWPPPARSWYRWAGRNSFPVRAIVEESALAPLMPDWRETALDWAELRMLPARWQAALAGWRGVYHILDTADGRRYVGSAAGTDNILGRWQNYASTGHGGNRHLLTRDPSGFRFSILERTSPDLPIDEVVRLEKTWKVRLGTRFPDGLNDN